MKLFIALIAVLGMMVFHPGSADARFLCPVFRLDCSTASSSAGGEWEVGCRCVQSGWIIGGMIIPDNVVGCHLSLGGNDWCNFHVQCQIFYGGGGTGGVAGAESAAEE